jgi:cobalt-zinc-cadmium efflux system membrane fusion protein
VNPTRNFRHPFGFGSRSGRALALGLALLAAGAVGLWLGAKRPDPSGGRLEEISSQTRNRSGAIRPSARLWALLSFAPVGQQVFRSGRAMEGKIVVDEDNSTPIFSPYAGRVMKLWAKPGDNVERGQRLFTIEATDMVQAQNDFITAFTSLGKARSQLHLAEIVDTRQRDLYEGKAVPLKEVEQARMALNAARNDLRSAEVAVAAARSRLRILGKTDQEIADFENTGTIDPETPIYAPISGTVVQRKVGPGQYVGISSADPVFVIGDLSTVWLIAYVREIDSPKVHVGQSLEFTVPAYPEQVFSGNVTFTSAALDAVTRRLLVRAVIPNERGSLKPEMFATVSIYADDGASGPAVPLDAVVYDGGVAQVWIVHDDRSIELRPVKTGLRNGNWVQILAGLTLGETIVTKGASAIDRADDGT